MLEAREWNELNLDLSTVQNRTKQKTILGIDQALQKFAEFRQQNSRKKSRSEKTEFALKLAFFKKKIAEIRGIFHQNFLPELAFFNRKL